MRSLTAHNGVYALCDLDDTPIYIGQSTKGEGVQKRVSRHLTSARSDVIATRSLDVWEIGFVRAWEIAPDSSIPPVEAWLYHEFNDRSPLMNGKVPARPPTQPHVPPPETIQVLPDDEIAARRELRRRLPRRAQQVMALLDYILEVKDEPHLRQVLKVHCRRLNRLQNQFLNKN